MDLFANYRGYRIDLNAPLDISFPLVPNVVNVNCYYAESPCSEVIRVGDFVGNVQEGGTVNYNTLKITPHGNGTHTECYGHISEDKITINQALQRFHFIARLVSVFPEQLPNGDRLVTLQSIENKINTGDFEALIIRTLPNVGKSLKQYSGTNPTYLSPEIGTFLAARKVEHLLVDLPSVDKEEDAGTLCMHRAFWNYPKKIRTNATITELIYVPDWILDGEYLLNLQIISLEMDASPSKPILFKIV